MRVLEPLKILESAVRECKERSIDTPEVKEALDVLDPYSSTKRMEGFRYNLRPSVGQYGADVEGQQQVLRVYFTGIHAAIRALIKVHLARLVARYGKTDDETLKGDIYRWNTELAKMSERWEFYGRK